MSRPLRLQPEARQEIEQRRLGLGVEFLEAMDDALTRAGNLGPDCRPALHLPAELGILRVLCKRFPYVVFFVATANAVRVLAVSHERRKPAYWLPRIRR